ncbi:MAG: hypothetical protein GY797_12285 [Deltaproteobacteria bacterium]|nr:hypothetical protein [Deltaproteobacteria bacterium]
MINISQTNPSINNQYIVNGNLSIQGVQNTTDFIKELKKLQRDLSKAIEQNALESDKLRNAEDEIKNAVTQAGMEKPNVATIVEHLKQVKELVTGSARFVNAMGLAIDAVKRIF